MLSMTPKQAELLVYLKQYIKDHNGIAPSFQEMADAIDLKSKCGIHRLLTALEERGLILRLPNRARAIQVFEPSALAEYPTSALIAELARRREMAPQRELRGAEIRRERATA